MCCGVRPGDLTASSYPTCLRPVSAAASLVFLQLFKLAEHPSSTGPLYKLSLCLSHSSSHLCLFDSHLSFIEPPKHTFLRNPSLTSFTRSHHPLLALQHHPGAYTKPYCSGRVCDSGIDVSLSLDQILHEIRTRSLCCCCCLPLYPGS